MEGTFVLGFWLVLIFGFWFWMSRKRTAQESRRKAFLSSLSCGDRVVTVGGIYGTVESLDGETVLLRVAEGVTIKLHRQGVNTLAGE